MDKYLLDARAKLNMYLDITARRADGYHELETVMQSVTLSDVVEVQIAQGTQIRVSCDKPDIPCGKSNVAYKAAERFFEQTGECAAVDIAITKRIPMGAGMGGGSADAAAVIAALGRHFGVSDETLLKVAAKTGADVPFCLFGGTKVCRGIGELMQDIEPLSGLFYLIVKPGFSCSTPAAFARYDNAPIAARNGLAAYLKGVSRGDCSAMYNIFEPLYNDARLTELKQKLISLGAENAMLTGSGAAVFGVFSDRESAETASRGFAEYTAVCAPCGTGIKYIG